MESKKKADETTTHAFASASNINRQATALQAEKANIFASAQQAKSHLDTLFSEHNSTDKKDNYMDEKLKHFNKISHDNLNEIEDTSYEESENKDIASIVNSGAFQAHKSALPERKSSQFFDAKESQKDEENSSRTTASTVKNAGCAKPNLESPNTPKKEEVARVVSIPIYQILPNPNQPRKQFSDTSIIKLADSIRQFGIIQPLTVRKSGHVYELIAGERRLRAAKELEWSNVPCIISEANEEKSAQISIIENLIREDLNIFEQALAIQALIDTYSLTQEQIAEKLSSSQSYIANKLRLLRFSPSERNLMLTNNLSERHARALLRISDSILREKALDTIIKNELNVSESEELVCSLINKVNNIESKQRKSERAYKDIPTFYNAVSRAIESAKSGNLGIKCRKIVGNNFTELTIIIPNTELQSEIVEDNDEKR